MTPACSSRALGAESRLRILWASKGWHSLDQLIAHELADQGHDVRLFTMSEPRGGWRIPVIHRHTPIPLTPILGPRRLRDACRSFNAEVVFANFALTYGNYGVRGAPKGTPVVVLTWGSDVLLHGAKPGLSLLTKHALRRAHRVVANASHLAKAAQQLGANDVALIPYGIDARTFAPHLPRPDGWPDEPGPWIGCNRNLKPLYDHATLLRGLSLVTRTPAPRMMIIGSGPERDNLEALAEELGIADRVYFSGRLPYEELPLYLGQCEVWASAALSDGLPLSMLEGMACGMKVLVGELPYVADWQVTGVTFPFTLQDPEDCARAMSEALDAPALAPDHAGRETILARGDVRRTVEGLLGVARQAGANG